MRHAALVSGLALALFAAPVGAAVTQSKSVLSGGGTHGSSGTVVMSAVLGDVIAGHSTAAPRVLWHGFHAPLPASLVGVDERPAPFVTSLGRITPNPARGPVTVRFGNAVRQAVSLEIFDLAGRRVRTLHRGELPPDDHERSWDLRSEDGREVGAGVYFVRLVTPGLQRGHRMLVIR